MGLNVVRYLLRNNLRMCCLISVFLGDLLYRANQAQAFDFNRRDEAHLFDIRHLISRCVGLPSLMCEMGLFLLVSEIKHQCFSV